MAAGAMASARMMVVVFMGEQTMTNVSLQGGAGAGGSGASMWDRDAPSPDLATQLSPM